MFRKHYVLTFFPSPFNPYTIIEKRSMPLWVWLIDKWFLYAHEWLYWINEPLHTKLMHPFCYAYNWVAEWAYKHERIDSTQIIN